MAIDCIAEIPGAVELSNWFGGFPSFIDAKAEFQINSDGTGWLRASSFRMSDWVDAEGFPVMEKRFVALFHFSEIKSVSITDFMPGHVILDELDIKKTDSAIQINFFDTAWGAAGCIEAKSVRIEFEPV